MPRPESRLGRRWRAAGATVRLVGLLVALTGAAEAAVVEVPLEIDARTIDARLAAALSLDADGRGRLVADRCNAVDVSAPVLAERDGELGLTLDLDVDLGTAVFGRCLGPRGWRGQALIRIEPAVADDGLSIVLSAKSAELRRPGGGRGLLTRPSKLLADRLLLPRLADVRVDLRQALSDLDALLRSLLGTADSGASLADRSRVHDVAVGTRGVRVVLAFDVAASGEPRAPVAPLDPSELAQWRRLEDELDGFLTAVVLDLAARAGDRDLRLDLLGVLLDARLAIAEALARDDPGPDPVRDLFIQSWDRLRPHLATLAASAAFSEDQALRLASFLAGADAIAAVDALGPDYGVEISREGLRALARLLLAEGAPSAFTPLDLEIDPRLRDLLGFPSPRAPPKPSAARHLLEWLFAVAHAADPSIAEALRRFSPGPKTLPDYLALVAKLLDEAAEAHLADSRMPAEYGSLMDPLLRATAWKESCWRHYVGTGPPPKVLRSAVGAVGMMQINARVWRGVYDLALLESDVRYNVGAGIGILEHYFVDYALRRGEQNQPGGAGNLVRATYAAYNGGPGQLARYRRESTPERLKAIDTAFWQLYLQVKSQPWPTESSCYSF